MSDVQEKKQGLRVLHTSDWHIGGVLYGRKRYEEHEAFLNWLGDFIEANDVDVLLVAGDIFDVTTPSNRAQRLYYQFLRRIARSCCRHTVITAGNHDSPSFLDAPGEILRDLDAHVVGGATDPPENEVIRLTDASGNTELIVCAAPYLRERDLRMSEAGESAEEKDRKIVEGVCNHYRRVCDAALEARNGNAAVPIVAMGHLFAAGASVAEDEGVREIYVGSLARIGAGAFPECIDYLALGHLHSAQRVGGRDNFRYSGAPLPMNFSEAQREKSVLLVDFHDGAPAVTPVRVPVFQALERISGDMDAIGARIEALKAAGSTAWLEVIYEGEELPGDLRARLAQFVEGGRMEILRIRNNRAIAAAPIAGEESETLNDLDEYEVFERCLDANAVLPENREALRSAYREIVTLLHEADVNAE